MPHLTKPSQLPADQLRHNRHNQISLSQAILRTTDNQPNPDQPQSQITPRPAIDKTKELPIVQQAIPITDKPLFLPSLLDKLLIKIGLIVY
ncbi:hypothetical protein [Aquitalea sp.]|uniref:hypothetical protein n=1 Tax=Aquitalea sp. TaxID=1872623 RepID=UPI00258603B3|nr:hypothetical protein [Aquitalea sp.]